MKSTIKVVLIFLCLYTAHGQNKHPKTFVYSDEGLNDYVVTRIDSVSKELAYQKTLEWITKNYTNPNVALISKVENEKLKIKAVAQKILEVRNVKSNLSYTVEISFKDNRYKFEVLSLKYNNKTDYKKIANFKSDKVLVKDFGQTPHNIESFFNQLNGSLKNFILGIKENDDW